MRTTITTPKPVLMGDGAHPKNVGKPFRARKGVISYRFISPRFQQVATVGYFNFEFRKVRTAHL